MDEDADLIFSPEEIPHGMLSSPQILYCLRKKLLVGSWNPSCLKSASYEMRLGNFSCWYEDGVRKTQRLGPETDLNRNIRTSLPLAPNSLTFVTTIESFVMPCDMIARFNLIARWVRKGMLLGTAPIVDPQFTGRLLIPIHNFSSRPVEIFFNEPLIAVEFTKTLPPDKTYVRNSDPFGNPEKYINETGPVESSVFAAINKSQKVYDDIASKTKIFSIAGAITLFLLICSNMTLLINIFNSAENARKSAIQAESVIKEYSVKNDAQYRNFSDRLNRFEVRLEELRENLRK
ncbi:MAG: hypothetical protein K2H64_12095 [Desulfovibrio sp.]|nr:hypothetical protein [Desulfovibrio sp.]